MSRLDAFLKNTGLFKARTQARRACDEGRVQVDGTAARGSRAVHIGMRIQVETDAHHLDVEVLDVPNRPVPRRERDHYLAEHARTSVARQVLSFDDEP